ncbi:MAG: diguanylate cyclase [Cellulomonas sp.]|nr:diguanylate cyclase [Actinomycetota bacterium]MCG2798628.1 diguanylate cyclase [Cellulomonas sp.]
MDVAGPGSPLDEPSARALLETMGVGVYVVDSRRRITAWNAGAQRLTGHAPADAIGRFCGDGLLDHVDEHGTTMCGTSCPLAATILDGTIREATSYLHRADGGLLPVRLTAAPLLDPDGAILGAVETFADDSRVRAAQERIAELERLALLDPLTGTGNRRHLDRCLERRASDLDRYGTPFGALMVDVDHFKAVNDSHGHDVGDRVIARVAETILLGVRVGDDVARYGGEEFVVLTGKAEVDELAALAERLRSLVARAVVLADGVRVRVTVSIGAASTREDGATADLLPLADGRMRRAKATGRNRVVTR